MLAPWTLLSGEISKGLKPTRLDVETCIYPFEILQTPAKFKSDRNIFNINLMPSRFCEIYIRFFIRSKEMIINIVHHHVMATQTSPTWEFHCQEIAITDHLSITQSILIPTYVRSMLKQPLVITYKLCQNFTRQWLLVDGTNAFRMVQNSRSVTISTSDYGNVILWIKNDETRQSM